MASELRQHHDAGALYIHRLTNWRFQDTAERLSLANQFIHADIDKMCYDMETELYYMLEDVNPSSGEPTWKELPAVAPEAQGEVNTISSVGTGVSLVAVPPKAGVDLKMKSLIQGDNMLITVEADEVRLDVVLPSVEDTDPALVTHTAAASLGGHRVVSMVSEDEVGYSDPTSYSSVRRLIGITVGAASIGTPVVIRTEGVMTEPSWSWTPDADIWLSPSGILTQTLPTTGWLVPMGTAIDATSIVINFGLMLQLS